MDVNGSPFICRVYDPAKIKVGEIVDGIVNRAVHFTGKNIFFYIYIFYYLSRRK